MYVCIDAVVSQSGVLAALGNAMRRFGTGDVCTLAKRTMLYLLSAPSANATSSSLPSDGISTVPLYGGVSQQVTQVISFMQSTWFMWAILLSMNDDLMYAITEYLSHQHLQ
jgi:hypothetical protein